MEYFKIESEFELIAINLLNLKDTIIPSFFLAFLNSPVLQISVPLFYTLSMSVMVWKKVPFLKGSGLNIAVVFNEGVLGLLLLTFLLLHFTGSILT